MEVNYKCNYCSGIAFEVIYEGIKDWEYGIPGDYAFRKCKTCSGVQIHPFPDTNDLIEAYNIDYHGYVDSSSKGFIYNLLYDLNDRMVKNQIKKFLLGNARVLDIGCGAGELLSKIRKMGAEVVDGIDFNENAIKMLNKKGINGFKGTFEDFKKEEMYYDLIIMNNYLEHTLNPKFELKKACSLLKKGGYLIGEVPGFDSFERRIFKKYWGGNHVPRHTYQFNQDFLKKIIAEAGFSEVKISHQINTGHIALSIQNYCQRKIKDLRNNTNLKNGRSKNYFIYLLLFIPINIIPLILKKTGVTKFYAKV